MLKFLHPNPLPSPGSIESITYRSPHMECPAQIKNTLVQSAVSSRTDLLVCGENVGAAKTGKAEKLGVRVVIEEEYVALLK